MTLESPRTSNSKNTALGTKKLANIVQRGLHQSAKPQSMASVFTRQYWLQIAIIFLAVVVGISSTAIIVKGLLLKTAMQQEIAHYWQRFEVDPNAPLPDTKNLYGYRWKDTQTTPNVAKNLHLTKGVHRLVIDGHKRVTAYDYRYGYHLLLIFGESNVNRLVWFFGLMPLMLTLAILYSVMWLMQRHARNTLSPVALLAKQLNMMRRLGADTLEPSTGKALVLESPFNHIDTTANVEAASLKQALTDYHQTLVRYLIREQRFTAEISHEIRTPMAVIKSNAQLLQLKQPDLVEAARILQAVDQMTLISNSLLALARQEKIESHPMQSLNTLLQTCIDDCKDALTKADMTIHLPEVDAFIDCNSTLVYIIFSNIMRNAISYSQATDLYIHTSSNAIHFVDNGIGFSDTMLARLLPNLDYAIYNPSAEGHGIGMVLVQRLSTLQGWKVKLFNNSNGGGCVQLYW